MFIGSAPDPDARAVAKMEIQQEAREHWDRVSDFVASLTDEQLATFAIMVTPEIKKYLTIYWGMAMQEGRKRGVNVGLDMPA